MAEEEAAAAAPEAAAPAPPKAPKGPLLLVLANLVLALGVMGMLVYTRILYKRPKITEEGERERLTKQPAQAVSPLNPGFVTIDPITVNLKGGATLPRADGTLVQGDQMHYITLGFSLELRNIGEKEKIEEIKPKLMDQIISQLGKKDFNELVTVQGRYVLRSQIIKTANELLTPTGMKGSAPQLVTNVYFMQFQVQ